MNGNWQLNRSTNFVQFVHFYLDVLEFFFFGLLFLKDSVELFQDVFGTLLKLLFLLLRSLQLLFVSVKVVVMVSILG